MSLISLQAPVSAENVPSLDAVTAAVGDNVHGILPRGVVVLIANYSTKRFDEIIFGPDQWRIHWGAIPVTLPTIEILRSRALELVTSTGRQPSQPIHELSARECANFIGELGEEEHPEPPEELYKRLNRPVRAGEQLAGFTCAVTFIPQYVRRNNRIFSVTSRTLALVFGLNPAQGHRATLSNPHHVFSEVFTPKDADETEPSCYFMMEQEPARHTFGKPPSELIGEISQLGKGWQLPEPRNLLATVFSRRVWKGELLYRQTTFTCCNGKSVSDNFLVMGDFEDEVGLAVMINQNDIGDEMCGGAAALKFPATQQLDGPSR